MVKGNNRSGSDASRRAAALAAKGVTQKDRGGKNIGAKDEHSRVVKGNATHQGPMKKR
jgi:hypothetical protein